MCICNITQLEITSDDHAGGTEVRNKNTGVTQTTESTLCFNLLIMKNEGNDKDQGSGTVASIKPSAHKVTAVPLSMGEAFQDPQQMPEL